MWRYLTIKNRYGYLPMVSLALFLLFVLYLLVSSLFGPSNVVYSDAELDKQIKKFVPISEIEHFIVKEFPTDVASSSLSLPPYLPHPHKFLIFSAANFAYVSSELLQNFLCSVSQLPYGEFLMSRLAFLPLDSDTGSYVRHTYPSLTSFDSDNYWHLDEGLLRASSGPTQSYFSYVIKKAIFLLKILELTKFDFLWTDSDLIWEKDPLPFFLKEGESIGEGCDLLFTDGVRWHLGFMKRWDPRVNAGFYYAKNTESTKRLFRTWVSLLLEIQLKNGADKEQTTLNRAFAILHAQNKIRFIYPADGGYPSVYDPNQVTICFLPTTEFPKWEELDNSEGKVVIAHANVGEKSGKDDELKRKGFWRLEGSSSTCPLGEREGPERKTETLIKEKREEREEKRRERRERERRRG